MLRVAHARPSEVIVRGMLGTPPQHYLSGSGTSGYQASACFYCGAPVTPIDV